MGVIEEYRALYEKPTINDNEVVAFKDKIISIEVRTEQVNIL
ncbi:hypothetical protein [Thermicanus aegyptius]|nr:hypothetical protein [Thermicanus aegyptius]